MPVPIHADVGGIVSSVFGEALQLRIPEPAYSCYEICALLAFFRFNLF